MKLPRLFGGPPAEDPARYLAAFDRVQLDFSREVLGPYLECTKVGEKQMRADVPLPLAVDMARHIQSTVGPLPARCESFTREFEQLAPAASTESLHLLNLLVMSAWQEEMTAYLAAAECIAQFGFSSPDLDALAARVEETQAERKAFLGQLMELRGQWPR